MSEVLAQLRSALDGAEAAYASKLADSQQSSLLNLVEQAKQDELKELHSAIEGALKFLPALLRPAVKRVLFPKD